MDGLTCALIMIDYRYHCFCPGAVTPDLTGVLVEDDVHWFPVQLPVPDRLSFVGHWRRRRGHCRPAKRRFTSSTRSAVIENAFTCWISNRLTIISLLIIVLQYYRPKPQLR